jgi:hypothetical protein
MHAAIAQYVVFALRRVGRVDRAPQSRRTVGGDLEAIAPRAGIGEVAAVAIAALAFEIERRGQKNEALRPGEAFEFDVGAPPHRATPAVGSDQIEAAMLRYNARRPAHLHRHRVGALRHVDDFMIEKYLDIRKKLQPVQNELRGLELFALHDERMPRVVFENGVIELRDQRLARPVPELKDRRDQTDAGHVADQRVVQEIQRRRMGGRGAQIHLQHAVIVEQAHWQPMTANEPGAKEPDRSAAGNQDSALVVTHPR